MTDNSLIESLLQGGQAMENGVKYLYSRHFGFVRKAQFKYGLGEDDAVDAFTDAIIYLRKNVLQNKFRGESSVSTYLFRIFSNKCIDILRKSQTNPVTIEIEGQVIEDIDPNPSLSLVKKENLEQLTTAMSHISESCRSVLTDWNDGYSMEEIAKRNKLLNEHTARSKRYNCFKELMKFVKPLIN
jgi:RNA polymerase sigma-70 factor (ECF subfamily)